MPVECCPICFWMYARLSQHIVVFHRVQNKDERKLLLSLESGRVNVREGICPLPGCGKETTRLDRHIKVHTELSSGAQEDALRDIKRKKVLKELAVLRESNPTVPMVSILDLQADDDQLSELEDPVVPQDCEEEKEAERSLCNSPRCKKRGERFKAEIADLNKQVDTLTETVCDLTRRYRKLKDRYSGAPQAGRIRQITKRLLSSLGPEDEDKDDAPVDPEENPLPQRCSPQPTTSQQAIARGESSAQQRNEERSPPHYPDHVSVLNDVLEKLREFQEGPDPSRKLKENISGKIYRVKTFLAFMAEGKSNLSNMVLVNETRKIHSWVSSLRLSGVTETTIKHYVDNVSQFIDFITETPPQTSRLSKNVMIGLRREMKGLRKSLKRGVAMHRTSVKASKEEKVLSKGLLLECRNKSKLGIPEALALLEMDPTPRIQWKFYGLFSAFLSSVFGHRGGVFQNMTIQEVMEAKRSSTENAFLINIKTHKTNELYGPAQIILMEEEYEWALRFLRLKDQLPGGLGAKFFFFVSTPNPCKNLNNYFQEAWKAMGLPGCPTFTDVRTSIASHAKFTHAPENRLKLCKYICHDVRTADKFYVTNLTAKQAVEHRRLFEAALEGPERSPASKDIPKRRRQVASKDHPQKKRKLFEPELSSGSTTPEDDQVTYQESGVSSVEDSQGESEPTKPSQDVEAERRGEEDEVSEHGQLKRQRRPIVLLMPLKSALRKKHFILSAVPAESEKDCRLNVSDTCWNGATKTSKKMSKGLNG
ncbi:uncharacterized protein LOC130547909 [Triplophysa rosa]|uniref:uncharacterized protein LOC130547909 n=1 Tax=Triplophysa rosa TaxID=992332 RepID=UPI0025460F34|nr:uncharacterized protein LOC130547909 [Triplophysa rosa]XP_057180274.1 uncharacterized protein LOC130547909 [Triplophysa rosa]XP_057180282.1 uncharacterized protein LOC130547909 [Triplophysa rosa]